MPKACRAAIKPIALGVLWSVIVMGPALAADMAVPATAPQGTSYFPGDVPINWGGVYLGINGGYAFGTSAWGFNGASTGGFSANGALAGGTIGVNYAAYGGFLFGVEGDIDWSNLNGTSSVAACVGLGAAAGTSCATKSNWLSTARARAGYSFNRFLVFGTAGGALGDLQVGLKPPGAFQAIGPQVGWTAGGGLEFAFTDSITAKAEYLYVNLGRVACPANTTCGVLSSASVSLTESLVRAGLNYKFSW